MENGWNGEQEEWRGRSDRLWLTLNITVRYNMIMMISDIYCGNPTNLGVLGSLSVVSRGTTVRHPVITKSHPMSDFGWVTVTTKLGQLSYDYDWFSVRAEDRTLDLKHRSTLTTPLHHRSLILFTSTVSGARERSFFNKPQAV